MTAYLFGKKPLKGEVVHTQDHVKTMLSAGNELNRTVGISQLMLIEKTKIFSFGFCLYFEKTKVFKSNKVAEIISATTRRSSVDRSAILKSVNL